MGGRGKGPTAKELSLSAALVGTTVRNALTGKAWILPGKKKNRNGYHRSHAHPQGEPELLKKEEQFIPPWAGFGESAPTGFQLVPWYLCQYQACFWQQKKKCLAYLCSLEKMTYKLKMYASDSGLVDLPCFH